MKTQKQVEIIGDALSDTMAKLIESGQQEIHVLEVMLSLAVSGCAYYGGCREMANTLRDVAAHADQWANAEEEQDRTSH
jgi:hypothetical protein